MVVSSTASGILVSWGADHRTGNCKNCHIPLNGKFGEKVCPQCGGAVGELICRQMSVEPPSPPECIRLSCLWRYVIDSWVYALVALYHTRRSIYAEANRDKEILERYRTGEPSPETLWGAIHANVKLSCPICRKYNVDPLLRR